MEDSGEVGLGLAEHEVSKPNGLTAFDVKHDVCFVLDPMSNKKRKKAWLYASFMFQIPNYYDVNLFSIFRPVKLLQTSAITFGTHMAFSKLRSSKNIQILWRMRPFKLNLKLLGIKLM